MTATGHQWGGGQGAGDRAGTLLLLPDSFWALTPPPEAKKPSQDLSSIRLIRCSIALGADTRVGYVLA